MEAIQQEATGPVAVRVHSAVGTAVAVWQDGAREAAEGEHRIEWTVDEDIAWAGNTWPAASPTYGVREDAGEHIVFRGRLSLTEDAAAVLDMGGTSILFGLLGPPPDDADGTWVEVRAGRSSVSVWPYQC
ncbi:hypothetical protein ACWGE1_16170 [Streptomyces sp. NPDC054932]